MRDLELHALTIRLEANRGKRAFTDYQHREHIVGTVRAVARRVACQRSTSTGPLHHFRDNHDTELIHGTDFTRHRVTPRSVLLHRNERRVVVQILHGLERRQQLRTHVHDTRTRNNTGIHHAGTCNLGSLLRCPVVIQIDRQTHQIAVGHNVTHLHFTGLGGIATVLDRTSTRNQVDLERILGHLTGTIQHLTVDMALQFGIRIEIQRFLGIFIEETKLLEGTFQLLALEAHSVNSTPRFRQNRHLAVDRADILGRTVQVAVALLHRCSRNRSQQGGTLGRSTRLEGGLGTGHQVRACTRLHRNTGFKGIDGSSCSSGAGIRRKGQNQIRQLDVVLGSSLCHTRSIDTLLIDVAIIKQRQIQELLDLLAHVLGHGLGVGQLTEELNLLQFNESLLLIEVGRKLRTNGRRATTNGIVIKLSHGVFLKG